MNDVTNNTAGEINRLHQLATQKANEAINYARQAGELLLQVKQALPHGQFGSWVEQNLQVSSRQCQRYMQVASGKTIAVRELTCPKYDTMSHLNSTFNESERDQLATGTWLPLWKPESGHWYCCTTEEGAFWVVPDTSDSSFFHISRLYSDRQDPTESFFDGTRWPEPADRVEIRLRLLGLTNPIKAEWKFRCKEGLPQPFGAPENHGFMTVKSSDGNEKLIQDAC